VVGVGAVVVSRLGVLLVERGAPPAQGLWSIPGGAVELGETLSQAVAREVWEETAVRVEVGPLVEVVERRLTDGQGRLEYHYVLLDYLCRAEATPPIVGDDAAGALWVQPHDLEGFELTQDTLAVIRRGLAMAM